QTTKERNAACRKIEKQLQRLLDNRHHHPPDHPTHQAIADLQDSLADLHSQATDRAALRARVNWLEQGERPTNYFYSRFRSGNQRHALLSLRDDNGNQFSAPDLRHRHVSAHFRAIYTVPPFD